MKKLLLFLLFINCATLVAMNDPKNPYEILGVRPDASQKVIGEKYRELQRKYHPSSQMRDTTVSEEDAREMLSRVTDAYALLSNSEARNLYDHQGRGAACAFIKSQNATLSKLGDIDSYITQIKEKLNASINLREIGTISKELHNYYADHVKLTTNSEIIDRLKTAIAAANYIVINKFYINGSYEKTIKYIDYTLNYITANDPLYDELKGLKERCLEFQPTIKVGENASNLNNNQKRSAGIPLQKKAPNKRPKKEQEAGQQKKASERSAQDNEPFIKVMRVKNNIMRSRIQQCQPASLGLIYQNIMTEYKYVNYEKVNNPELAADILDIFYRAIERLLLYYEDHKDERYMLEKAFQLLTFGFRINFNRAISNDLLVVEKLHCLSRANQRVQSIFAAEASTVINEKENAFKNTYNSQYILNVCATYQQQLMKATIPNIDIIKSRFLKPENLFIYFLSKIVDDELKERCLSEIVNTYCMLAEKLQYSMDEALKVIDCALSNFNLSEELIEKLNISRTYIELINGK